MDRITEENCGTKISIARSIDGAMSMTGIEVSNKLCHGLVDDVFLYIDNVKSVKRFRRQTKSNIV
jgi:hypothetical protein